MLASLGALWAPTLTLLGLFFSILEFMSPSDHISSLRSLASEVASCSSGASLKQQSAKGLLDILRLRRQFVDLIYEAEAEKEVTAKSRSLLEAVRLIVSRMDLTRSDPIYHIQADSELQNLLYEQRYYEMEISLCRGFMSKFPDASIDLQSEEEFWDQADEVLKAQARGTTSEAEGQGVVVDAMDEGLVVTDDRADARKMGHILTLASLEHEMRLRKKMAVELEAAKKSKALLQQRVQEKERTYKGILTTLQEIEAVAVPLIPFSDPLLLDTVGAAAQTAD